VLSLVFKTHAQDHAHEDVDELQEDERPPKWLFQYEYSSLVKNGRRKKSSDILQLVVFTVGEGEHTE